jgi:predicted RNA methylase
MNPQTFNRLHELRMDNDAAGFAMDELRPRFDRLAHRKENGAAPRAVSAFQLFQTPPGIAARLVEALHLKPGARILEPSAGLGRILNALATAGTFEITAVEIAAQCAGELYTQNRAGVTIKQRDFLACTPGELGLFDAVAMNPPFHLRADIRHIQHALKFLKPGGTLAALCMNTPHRHAALLPLVDASGGEWIELPAGEFSKEGTGVASVLLTIHNRGAGEI